MYSSGCRGILTTVNQWGELYITKNWESEYVSQECSEFSPAVPQLEVVDAH